MNRFLILATWFVVFSVGTMTARKLGLLWVEAPGLREKILVLLTSPLAYLTGLAYLAGAFLYFLFLARTPVSVALPVIVSLGLAVGLVVGHAFFQERLVSGQWLGLVLVLVGLGLVLRPLWAR